MTDLKYSIAVDANQADAELARLHQSATTLAGSEDKLAASTTAATAVGSTRTVSVTQRRPRAARGQAGSKRREGRAGRRTGMHLFLQGHGWK